MQSLFHTIVLLAELLPFPETPQQLVEDAYTYGLITRNEYPELIRFAIRAHNSAKFVMRVTRNRLAQQA